MPTAHQESLNKPLHAHPNPKFYTIGLQAREELRRTGDWPSATTTSPSDNGNPRPSPDGEPQMPRRRNATDTEHMFLPPNPYPPGAQSFSAWV